VVFKMPILNDKDSERNIIDNGMLEKILEDDLLREKVLANNLGARGLKKKMVNEEAARVMAMLLVLFVLGIFIASPFFQLLLRVLLDLLHPDWRAGVSDAADLSVFYNAYHNMIRGINFGVYVSITILYLYWIVRIIVGWKYIRKPFSQIVENYLPFLVFIIFGTGILLVTWLRGPNRYDLHGHPYMMESIFSYALYPITYFFCGMMLWQEKRKKILLYTLVFTAFPINLLALLVAYGVPFPYFYKQNGVIAVFHNSNHYGYYLAFVLMVSALLFVYEEKAVLKIVLLISFCLTTLMLVINNTLGAFLATGFVLTIFLLYRFFDEKKKLRFTRDKSEGNKTEMITANNAGTSNEKNADDTENMLNKDAGALKRFEKKFTRSGSWQSAFFVLVLYIVLTLALSIHYNTILNSLVLMFSDAGDIVADPSMADAAGSGRWKLWKNTVAHIPEHPLLGFGVEGLLNTYQVGTPHNELLQYAAFFGIPVAVLYVIANSLALVRIWIKREKMHPMTMVCFFTAIGYLVNSMFGVAIYYTTPFLFIFLGLAYAECLKCEAEEEKDKSEMRNFGNA